MKLMILDGNSIVNRAYYGIRMLNAPDGTPTNGVYGFLTILQRMLDEVQPEGVCVAFDRPEPTFRHLKYDGYKAQRKGMPEELAVQMPLLKETLDAMGITRLELAGWEADDLLGTVSRLCEKAGDTCVVVTGDKDSFQLITEKTAVRHVKTRMGQTETVNYTPEVFRAEYGFEPKRMVDLKALMGDASDNIPGVPGCGEKTAMTLIQTFGTLEAVYAHLDSDLIKPAMRKKLEAGRPSAELSYDLAAIRCDAPLPFDLASAVWHRDFRPELYDLFLRLGFRKLIEKWGLKAPETSADNGETFTGECTIAELTDLPAAEAAAKVLQSAHTACYWCLPELDFVAIDADDAGGEVYTAYVLRRADFSGDYDKALAALFAPEIKKAGHNVKDLQRALLEKGVPAENWVFDTALAAYLLDATAGSYELRRLCVTYCGFEPWRRPTAAGDQLSLLDDPEKTRAEENAEWASMASAVDCLREALEKKLREEHMWALYTEIELPLCAVLADMERSGFLVNRKALREFGESMTATIDALQRSIWDQAGEEFNILSPKQLGTVLFDKLMLPAGKKTKTGWSTNADVLERLRDKHPIVGEILDYRMLTKLKSTYTDGLLKVIASDGRIRTSFMMTVTDTGRLSSREPNLQNIPIRREFGGQIRKMFVAAPGKVLVDADYSQIELRLLAHISQDENMIAAFRSGEDIHAVTASQVFGIPLPQVTKLQRSHAKAVNFGIVYGISAWSLAQDIGVFPNEAKAYMDAYLEKYHGVRDYQKSIVERARVDGYVSTLYGRRRALPELKSSNFALRAFGERVALNMPIQGTAADVIKLAMIRVHGRLEKENLAARLILQVHDELIVECPEGEAEQVEAILTQEMQAVADLSVPLVAEAHAGRSWYEAK